MSTSPPSMFRLTPLIERFSSRNVIAPVQSRIVTGRLVSARVAAASRAAGLSLQKGVSATMLGCRALTRIGESSTASVLTSALMPPLAVVTVVEPG